jgi:hypothetical protein
VRRRRLFAVIAKSKTTKQSSGSFKGGQRRACAVPTVFLKMVGMRFAVSQIALGHGLAAVSTHSHVLRGDGTVGRRIHV